LGEVTDQTSIDWGMRVAPSRRQRVAGDGTSKLSVLADDLIVTVLVLIFFALLSAIFLAQVRPDPAGLVRDAILLGPTGISVFLESARWFAPLLVLWILLIPPDHRPRRLAYATLSLLGCSIFVSLFSLMKGSLVYGAPFHADAALAQVDLWLHGGHRPVELTHALAPYLPARLVELSYVTLWLFPAMFLPVGLILGDSDRHRRLRFAWLYFFVWIGLGLVFAYLFLSAGPVYHDRLVGGVAFADLPMKLRQAGLGDTMIPLMQEQLWHLYKAGHSDGASGIAAFPSVHVGMATVVGLYLFDRWKWLALPALLIPLWYQFLSVYTGWHYAVDGYFSILAVTALWLLIRRTQRQSARRAVDRSAEAA
jgi:hypothetical protein